MAVVAGRGFAHVLGARDMPWDRAFGGDAPGCEVSGSVTGHDPSLRARAYPERMSEWYYNNKTGEVEEGKQSLGVDRDGPYASREEAERAPQIAQERAAAWNAEDDD